MEAAEFRRLLLDWYGRAKRDLPWRQTSDPYAILVSEVMLQQTRVAAAIRFYQLFLARFPTAETLADAPVEDVLHAWAGLGYYYRARNLQQAAQEVKAQGQFPRVYEGILALRGVGAYTAAAVASIAFGLPHAVLDGNVLRVLSRVCDDDGDIASGAVKARFQRTADALLDRDHPGDFNQAIMELGATICLPRQPHCLVCPVASLCKARQKGTQNALPVKGRKMQFVDRERTLLFAERDGKLLLRQRPQDESLMPGFYELPEEGQIQTANLREEVALVRHTITHHRYTFRVRRADIPGTPDGCLWAGPEERKALPISTVTRKALKALRVQSF